MASGAVDPHGERKAVLLVRHVPRGLEMGAVSWLVEAAVKSSCCGPSALDCSLGDLGCLSGPESFREVRDLSICIHLPLMVLLKPSVLCTCGTESVLGQIGRSHRL